MRKILLKNAKEMERIIKILTVALMGVVIMSASGRLYAMKSDEKSREISVFEQQMAGSETSSTDEALCSHTRDDKTEALKEQEAKGERTSFDLSDDRGGVEEPKGLSDVKRADISRKDLYLRNIKIVAISDIHGFLPRIEEKGDILLIAGDIVRASRREYECLYWWYREVFIRWAQSLDFEKIVMVAGNHDYWLEQNEEKFRWMIKDTNIIYLKNEYVDITIRDRTVTIYGTPLCHKRHDGAFVPEDDVQREIYARTMDDRHIDILLSHDAPFGCSDVCYVPEIGRAHVGSEVLRDVVLWKRPDFLIHGHLHASNHGEEILGSTRVYNVALLGNDYKPRYEPRVFELRRG